MVYLTSRKPDRAISALRTTRIADLSANCASSGCYWRHAAKSDVGRHDLGLEHHRQYQWPRSDPAALRHLLGVAAAGARHPNRSNCTTHADRWRDFKPLNPLEKGDVIRAVVGYALAEDAIGLARLREKYAPLMSGEADRFSLRAASKRPTANQRRIR